MTYGRQPGHGRPGFGGPGQYAGSGAQAYGPGYGGHGHAPQPGYPQAGHGQGGYGSGGYQGGHGSGGYQGGYGSGGYQGGYGQGGQPQQPYGAPPAQHPGYAPPAPAKRRRAPMVPGGPVTDEDERWAVPAYVGMFVVGFIAPAIVYVAKGRSSRFARFHAVQALNLSIALLVGDVLGFAAMYYLGMTGLLIMLAVLAVMFFCIVKAAIGANRCEWYRLPAIAAWPIFR